MSHVFIGQFMQLIRSAGWLCLCCLKRSSVTSLGRNLQGNGTTEKELTH